MRKSIGRVAVVVAVLAAFLAIPGVALAHHSSIEFSPGCLEADGSFDFDYTITAATNIGALPENMQNEAVEVWISYDGGTPCPRPDRDFRLGWYGRRVSIFHGIGHRGCGHRHGDH